MIIINVFEKISAFSYGQMCHLHKPWTQTHVLSCFDFYIYLLCYYLFRFLFPLFIATFILFDLFSRLFVLYRSFLFLNYFISFISTISPFFHPSPFIHCNYLHIFHLILLLQLLLWSTVSHQRMV